MEDVVAAEKNPVRKFHIVSRFTFSFTCSLLSLHVKQPAYCHFWSAFFIIHFLCSLCNTVAKPAYSFSIYCDVTRAAIISIVESHHLFLKFIKVLCHLLFWGFIFCNIVDNHILNFHFERVYIIAKLMLFSVVLYTNNAALLFNILLTFRFRAEMSLYITIIVDS